jgi:hypothetical protein
VDTDREHEKRRPQEGAAGHGEHPCQARDRKQQTPSAGPAKRLTLAIVLAAAFAAVSCSGVLANEGRSAACAERKSAIATLNRSVNAWVPGARRDGRSGAQAVEYSGLIAPLIEAVKELDDRLRAIEERLGREG